MPPAPDPSTDLSSPAADSTSEWLPSDATQAVYGQDTVPVPQDVPHDAPAHDAPVPPAPAASASAAPAPSPSATDVSALPPPLMPPPYAPESGQPTGTIGLAIAALCCGLAAFIPIVGVIAIVLGVIALNQLRGTFQGGRGLAIAGIVLGTLGTLFWAGMLVLGVIAATTSEPTATSSSPVAGQVAGQSEVFVDDLEAGDCFSGGKKDQIDLVTAIPCTSPHESQVVTVFELPDEPYPGEDNVIDAAEKGCTDKADPLLTDEAYNDLDPSFIYPDSYTWRGDRSVLCLVEAPSGTTTGSALK